MDKADLPAFTVSLLFTCIPMTTNSHPSNTRKARSPTRQHKETRLLLTSKAIKQLSSTDRSLPTRSVNIRCWCTQQLQQSDQVRKQQPAKPRFKSHVSKQSPGNQGYQTRHDNQARRGFKSPTKHCSSSRPAQQEPSRPIKSIKASPAATCQQLPMTYGRSQQTVYWVVEDKLRATFRG
jgi:hypothetical protein